MQVEKLYLPLLPQAKILNYTNMYKVPMGISRSSVYYFVSNLYAGPIEIKSLQDVVVFLNRVTQYLEDCGFLTYIA